MKKIICRWPNECERRKRGVAVHQHQTSSSMALMECLFLLFIYFSLFSFFDLAPSNFHLFGKLKKHLRRRRFPIDDSVEDEVVKWLNEQDTSFYRVRYDKCLNKFGYVEK